MEVTYLQTCLLLRFTAYFSGMDDDFLLILRVSADTTVNKDRNCSPAILFYIQNIKNISNTSCRVVWLHTVCYVFIDFYKIQSFKKTDEILFESCIKHGLY